jgi:hypothetical protein
VTTILVQEDGWRYLGRRRDVDAVSQPGKQTLGDSVAEQGVLDNGVVLLVGDAGEPHVDGVGGQGQLVLRVRVDLLNLVNKVLVKVRLADVAAVDEVAQRLVLVAGGVCMGQDVDVGGAAEVVAREESLELGNAVLVGRLDAASPGLVDVVDVVDVAVAGVDDTRVDAGRVGVPDLEVQLRDRLARVNVDELVVNDEGDALLSLDYVATNSFAADI